MRRLLVPLPLVSIVAVIASLAPGAVASVPRAAEVHYCNSSRSMFVVDLHNMNGGAACVVARKLFAWLEKPHHRISRCTAVNGKPVLVAHSWEGYRLSISRIETLVLTRKDKSFSVAGFSDAPIGCS
ncbi:MAG TPA: hypothetical protein VHX62_13130 [Solirubrobacteraceae bacterium]|jgi:hypothetical protein|nr:hypothetical protein [Solirubrobacteraceae bacterium]